jgi:hypothetical protein
MLAYEDLSNRARHLNSPVVPRPLAHRPHTAVTGKAYGNPATEHVVLQLNKLTRPMIVMALAVSTTTTKEIIEEAGRR